MIPDDDQLEILYQDEYLVVINKPSGLLVHRSLIDKHETRFAIQLLRDQIGQRVYPVHRLDKPTSGVLVFALDSETARALNMQFTGSEVEKQYLAVVRGFADEQGHIDHPLKEQLDRIADAQADQDKAAQSAITDYQRLATVELPFAVGRYPTARYSLLKLWPRTGRKHQLRRHMKHIFHPIVGDTTHGDGRHNDFFRQQFNNQRLLLAATQIRFRHPHADSEMVIRAGVGTAFEQLLEALTWAQIKY